MGRAYAVGYRLGSFDTPGPKVRLGHCWCPSGKTFEAQIKRLQINKYFVLQMTLTNHLENPPKEASFRHLDDGGLDGREKPPSKQEMAHAEKTQEGMDEADDAIARRPDTSGFASPEDPSAMVPIFILVTTYLNYFILTIIGHIRDFFGKILCRSYYSHLSPSNVLYVVMWAVCISWALVCREWRR